MSAQDSDLAEIYSSYPVTMHERLDLLPNPGTMESLHANTRNVIPPSSFDSLRVWTIFGPTYENSVRRVLLNLSNTLVFSAVSTVWASVITGYLGQIIEEQQRYECKTIKTLTSCFRSFDRTMKVSRPFLPMQRITVHPEIRANMESDQCLRKLMDAAIVEMSNVLKDEDSYLLEVFEENDVEVPKWTENVIRVKVENRNFENKIKLWESLEEKVRSKISEIRKQLPAKQRRKVDKINECLSIRVEEETL